MKVGIIGNGFVGSALIQAFRLKSEILVYDIQDSKSNSTLEKVSKECDFVFVCLPTPMNVHNNGIIDTKIIEDVFEKISSINSEAIYVIKSTVIPGDNKKIRDEISKFKDCF
jgi:UDP-glucose 6-dehydrogenase